MVIKPAAQVHTMFPSKFNGNYNQYLIDLVSVPANANIYDLWGWDKPKQIGGTLSKIGTITLDGKLIESSFGDELLFFRHQLLDDDIKIMP